MKYLLLIFVSNVVWADWYCKESGSRMVGNSFYSCGVGEGKSLWEARSKSLEHAQKEFNNICSQSLFCEQYEIIVHPMRTDCSKKGSTHICFRAVKYTITREIRESYMMHQRNKNIHAAFGLNSNQVYISDKKATLFGLFGLQVEKSFYQRSFGLRYGLNYSSENNKSLAPIDYPRESLPNSVMEYDDPVNSTHNYVGLPVYLGNSYFMPEIGISFNKYTKHIFTFDKSGYKSKVPEKEIIRNTNKFYGIGIGYFMPFGTGDVIVEWFIEGKYRRVQKYNKNVISLELGIRY